jgi:hypothetical protein
MTDAQLSAAAQAVYDSVLPHGDTVADMIADAPWLLDDDTIEPHRARVLAICSNIAKAALQAAEAVGP